MNNTFELFPLITDHLVLVTGIFHPLASYKSLDIKDIAGEKFVSMTNNSFNTEIFISACNQAGFNLNIAYESDHIHMILSFVSDGLGVCLLTSQVVKKFRRQNKIKIINLNDEINVTIALAVPKVTNLSSNVRTFKKYTLEWFRK